MNAVTQILSKIQRGDTRAADKLLPLVYEELRRLAAQRLSKESPGQTLQATALVHEAFLRLVGSEGQGWQSRGHFFAAAAEAMRRILVDQARRKQRVRHGGDRERVELGEVELASPAPPEDILAVNEALMKLAEKDERKAMLVKLRYFSGLTVAQAADVLRISPETAKDWWGYTRAWLHREIGRRG